MADQWSRRLAYLREWADELQSENVTMLRGDFLLVIRRAERVEKAAEAMLRFGEHDGDCDQSGRDGRCSLHAEAMTQRTAALIAALEAEHDGVR